MSSLLLFVHALSPLHAGTGQSIGAIDLPTAREKSTGLPYLPGSSLKGSLRDVFAGHADQRNLFGPDTKNASDHAGALVFGDANLLLLPVRSVSGTWAWATSPYLLERFVRDAAAAVKPGEGPPAVPDVATVGDAVVTSACSLRTQVNGKSRIVFEDLDLAPTEAEEARGWAAWFGTRLFPANGEAPWRSILEKKLCIVHDDILSFLADQGTDVVARVALDVETKTVKQGALWYEESLPVESVLSSLVTALPNGRCSPEEALVSLRSRLGQVPSVQLGGKATVGRGRCRLAAV